MFLLPILFLSIALVTGCASGKRNPLPTDQFENAEVLNTKGIRTFGGVLNPLFQEDLLLSLKQIPKDELSTIQNNALLLSGGGSYGAFGAGFLNGWSSSGTRPEFKLVTGISTGALIAPLAFVGEQYDAVLQKMYTGVSTEDVANIRGISALWNDSLADSAPLMEILEVYIDEDFVELVAQAHNEGRRLYIGTTNLDAQRFVIWNMGALANINDPRVPEFFRKIMLASASIPVVYPPVMIEVTSDGQVYDEMHVDGGVITQVFFTAAVMNIEDVRKETLGENTNYKKGKIYIILNGTVQPNDEVIDRNIFDITDRSLTTLLKASAISDLRRIYNMSKKEGLDISFVGIPDDFEFIAEEPFDRMEMIELYYTGCKIGTSPDRWEQVPWTIE